MEKRVLFRSRWLPWALLLPQLAIVGVFFFWPASQAILQSVQMEDADPARVEYFLQLKNLLDQIRCHW